MKREGKNIDAQFSHSCSIASLTIICKKQKGLDYTEYSLSFIDHIYAEKQQNYNFPQFTQQPNDRFRK